MAEGPHVGHIQAAPDADLDHPRRIQQALLHRPAERCAVVKARAQVVVARVAMGIDMHHADRPAGGDGAQDGQGYRVIPADRQRHHAGLADGAKDRLDFGMSAFELEWLLDPGIAEVGDTHQIERCDAGRLVMLAHQRRLASHLARAVPRAGTVGHPAVEGHADDADVDPRQVLLIRCAEERRYPEKRGRNCGSASSG